MKPCVSILIPAFNAQSSIADTLRSAIAQTWEPKEIIVVDDGSTDDTLAIAREFQPASVCVISKSNEGAAATRNAAYSHSRGDYIQWLDADDVLSPNKIAAQIRYATSHGATRRTLLSCAWGHFLYRFHRADFVPSPLWCDLSPAEWILRKMENAVFMQTSTWLVSRELTDAAGPWNTELLGDDDGEYFCRVLLASCGVLFVPDARVYYRRSGLRSLSYVGRSDRKMDALFLSLHLHIKHLRSLHDDARVRAACVKFLEDSLLVFYPERPDLVEHARELAATLGGRLTVPSLSWKYAWMQRAFGWPVAKRAQSALPACKWRVLRSWDRALSVIDRPNMNAITNGDC